MVKKSNIAVFHMADRDIEGCSSGLMLNFHRVEGLVSRLMYVTNSVK